MIKNFVDCLLQSQSDLSCIFLLLNKQEKRRIQDAKHYLKSEIKNIIRDVKIKNSRKVFDEIRRIDEDIQLLLIDLNTQQFKLTFKMEEITKELNNFN